MDTLMACSAIQVWISWTEMMWDQEFRVRGLGGRVQGLGERVQGFGGRLQGLGLGVFSLGIRD
jgi:hypothetical protein